jgi:hypothetical protein
VLRIWDAYPVSQIRNCFHPESRDEKIADPDPYEEFKYFFAHIRMVFSLMEEAQ